MEIESLRLKKVDNCMKKQLYLKKLEDLDQEIFKLENKYNYLQNKVFLHNTLNFITFIITFLLANSINNSLSLKYLDNKKTIIEFLQLIIYLLPFSLSTKICLNDEELFNSKKELKDMIDDYYFKKQQFLKIIGILDEYNAIINNELNSVKKF